jgi:hypothetical protein
MPVSADTLLRLIRAEPVSVTTAPRVIGIDDWAWRRGQRYGTLIVDLERNRPVDLLPDRDAQTVAAWLQSHPGIEIVARDRAGAYADGIRRGAPEAVQVGDRWHLLRNLSDALARALDRHQHDLRAATASVVEVLQSVQAEPEVPLASPAVPPAPDRHAIRRARFDEALALHSQGWSVRRIARALTSADAGTKAAVMPPSCGGRSDSKASAGSSGRCNAGFASIAARIRLYLG